MGRVECEAKKPKKKPDTIFWDEVNKEEKEKADKSFTGLK
jgi:hypothetical protein